MLWSDHAKLKGHENITRNPCAAHGHGMHLGITIHQPFDTLQRLTPIALGVNRAGGKRCSMT
jgi:hypothetical protein